MAQCRWLELAIEQLVHFAAIGSVDHNSRVFTLGLDWQIQARSRRICQSVGSNWQKCEVLRLG